MFDSSKKKLKYDSKFHVPRTFQYHVFISWEILLASSQTSWCGHPFHDLPCAGMIVVRHLRFIGSDWTCQHAVPVLSAHDQAATIRVDYRDLARYWVESLTTKVPLSKGDVPSDGRV